jgi:sterol desaturase/sphingolipid hydroxylase (fatty acid hydroxylase superfamily)
MDFSPVVLAIPIYFLLIGVELIIQQYRKIQLYRLHDAVTNISCGMTQQLTGLFFKVATIGIYQFFYEHFRVATIAPTWYTLIILFIAADFLYYWAHRMSHEINLFWGGHVVHHQSEDYNLSVALRQGSFQVIWTFAFYLPLAFAGFDTISFAAMSGLVTVYQFWIHTETIGKMGWFEWIFNTPSHHRVHHGRDPKYIDRNHAGVFIIWDRMFGTFKEEEEKPTYGITTPVDSWNPFWVNIHHYKNLMLNFLNVKGLKNKLKILFYKPGWMPEEMGGYQAPQRVPSTYRKFETSPSKLATIYGFFQYVIALLTGALFLFTTAQFTIVEQAIVALLLIFTITVTGGMFEVKKWVIYAEIFRLLGIGLFGYWLFYSGAFNLVFILGVVVYIIGSSIGVILVKNRTFQIPKFASVKSNAS